MRFDTGVNSSVLITHFPCSLVSSCTRCRAAVCFGSAGVPDVFRSPFQTCPLDLDTDAFYPARRQQLDTQLTRIADSQAGERVHAAPCSDMQTPMHAVLRGPSFAHMNVGRTSSWAVGPNMQCADNAQPCCLLLFSLPCAAAAGTMVQVPSSRPCGLPMLV